MTHTPQTIYLRDYTVPPYLISTTDLEFDLYDHETIVTSHVHYTRNGASQSIPSDLVLHGYGLELISVSIDGQTLTGDQYEATPDCLTLVSPPEDFVLTTVTRIHPETNTALEGLYVSGAKFTTQCEAEGFRRITYYLDRPDVMAVFTTRIIADRESYPILLSNGNQIEQGSVSDTRHFAVWHDPFPKPAYLFALVAGDLEYIEGEFVTMSGRSVTLRIYTEAHNIPKCGFALESIQRAMRWDEERYGLEYDLDIFMVVAVDDFNSGAMENKGLNIFNSALVFATPESATDRDYVMIERVIAHEYFHNWTGDRVTCRDWFQLSLKEGLTVYRDSEFTADIHSRSVKRIEDVRYLRDVQFREDASPMAHPIRPSSFEEIRNFYTVTVYEKGSEVIRMYETILGREGFRRGMDLYFERHDGQAVTTEDFLAAMADANHTDLSQFSSWYNQAGTPIVRVRSSYDPDRGEYTLHLSQSCPPTPESHDKKAFIIPIRLGLISRATGEELTLSHPDLIHSDTIIMRDTEESYTFTGIHEEVVPSLLRGFSAPVRLEYPYTHAEYALLMQHDTDDFNRYEAKEKFATEIMLGCIRTGRLEIPESFIQAYGQILTSTTLDHGLQAEALILPSEGYIYGLIASSIDPSLIHDVREYFTRTLAMRYSEEFFSLYTSLISDRPYRVHADDIADRKLKNICLGFLAHTEHQSLVYTQYMSADNMTDSFAALSILSHMDVPERMLALEDFATRWHHDANVMNKWFSVQSTSILPGVLEEVQRLSMHPDFDPKNPNKLRALYSGYAMSNPSRFHAIDGSGYRYIADRVLEIDTYNSQVAGRLAKSLVGWRELEPVRSGLLHAELARMALCPTLSPDTGEVVRRALAG